MSEFTTAEGLTLASPNEALNRLPALGRVEAARLLGRTSLVHLSVPASDGRTLHLHARMPGIFLPPDGSHVSVVLDARQAFVFPASSPT